MHIERLKIKNLAEFEQFFLKEKINSWDFENLKEKNCFLIKDNRKNIFGFSFTFANQIKYIYLNETYRHKTYGSKLLFFTEEFLFRYFIIIKVKISENNNFFLKNAWEKDQTFYFKKNKNYLPKN